MDNIQQTEEINGNPEKVKIEVYRKSVNRLIKLKEMGTTYADALEILLNHYDKKKEANENDS